MAMKVDPLTSSQQPLIQSNKVSDIKIQKQKSSKDTQELKKQGNSPEINLYKEAENKKEMSSLEDFIEKANDQKVKELDDEQKKKLMEKIKEKINKLLSQWNIQLDFIIDNDLDRVVVKVKNKETGKIIRQIPPEEMLRIAKSLEEVSGLLLDLWG